jgi:hypothetical protein
MAPHHVVATCARIAALIPMAISAAILLVAARMQAASGEAQNLWARLDSAQEFLQRLRASYVWISLWPQATVVHHLLLLAIVAAAFARLRRAVPVELRALLLGLAAVGIVSMPLSWLLLEQWKWTLVPQVQPLRALLFVALAMQFLTAPRASALATGKRRRRLVVHTGLPAPLAAGADGPRVESWPSPPGRAAMTVLAGGARLAGRRVWRLLW